MKYCPKCGAENPDTRRWCVRCMKPIQSGAASASGALSSEIEVSRTAANSRIFTPGGGAELFSVPESESVVSTPGISDPGALVPETSMYSGPANSGPAFITSVPETPAEPPKTSGLTGKMGKKTYGNWMDYPLGGKKTILIGRDKSCDIVESRPYIASQHARITGLSGRHFLADCDTDAGTYLNGARIFGDTILNVGDCISICDCNYYYQGDKLLYLKRDGQEVREALRNTEVSDRPVVLSANIATKRVKNNSGAGTKELIRDIRLDIHEGTLVALLGTAGAGKSTVMNCLNGMDLEGVQGSVEYRGVDLFRNFDQMKYLIGSVPQKKVFHKTFTPEQEFRLAARKRLPADTTDQEIEQRVDRTLEMLSMNGVRKNKNSKLSGGEQTRVNVGIELVADRDLLCLDEPDQGLSPNYKHELFEIMRNLAHANGKNVLSIIHDVSEIDMFDQVIMLAKVDGVGRLAFAGTPEEARNFFGVDIRDAYALLEREPKRFVK